MRKKAQMLDLHMDALTKMPPEDRKHHLGEHLFLEVQIDTRDILQKGLRLLEILAVDHAKTR